jgi:hypothetical protein
MNLDEIPQVNWPENSGRYKIVQLEIEGRPYLRFPENVLQTTHPKILECLLIEFGRGYPTIRRIDRSLGEVECPALQADWYTVLGAGKAGINVRQRHAFFSGKSIVYDIGINSEHLASIRQIDSSWDIGESHPTISERLVAAREVYYGIPQEARRSYAMRVISEILEEGTVAYNGRSLAIGFGNYTTHYDLVLFAKQTDCIEPIKKLIGKLELSEAGWFGKTLEHAFCVQLMRAGLHYRLLGPEYKLRFERLGSILEGEDSRLLIEAD